MSLAAMFQSAVGRLRCRKFGRVVDQPDGSRVDTGVQMMAEELIHVFSEEPIELTEPVTFINRMARTPAIQIIDAGGGGGVQVLNAAGEVQALQVETDQRTLIGTENQVTVNDDGVGTVVFSGPQDLAPTSSPTFVGITLTGGGGIPGAGSPAGVFFGSATGSLAQDLTRFVYDDTTDRLGLGTASPSYKLHVAGAGGGGPAYTIGLENASASLTALSRILAGESLPAESSTNYTTPACIGLQYCNSGTGFASPNDANCGVLFTGGGATAGMNVSAYAGSITFFTQSARRARISDRGNVLIGPVTGDATANDGQVLIFGDNASNPTLAANTAALYGIDVAGTVELRVQDEAGNVTTISPHCFELCAPSEEMAWSYHSEKHAGGKIRTIEVDMLKLVRIVEELSGHGLVHYTERDAPKPKPPKTVAPPVVKAPPGRFGIVIGTYDTSNPGQPRYGVEACTLNLAVCRANNPDAMILVCDDGSPPESQALYRAACAKYGAQFYSNPERQGHTTGDMRAFCHGLWWARKHSLHVIAKLSHRFMIDSPNWLASDAMDLLMSGHGTATQQFNHRGNMGVRTEAVLMVVDQWFREDVLDHIGPERRIGGWWNEGQIWDAIRKMVDADRPAPHFLPWERISPMRGGDAPPVYFRDMQGDALAAFRTLSAKYGVPLSEHFSCEDSVNSDDYLP